MHAKHRSPGNGYRSGSVGMGLEGSGRNHGGFYSSEYRSFNRSFSRGHGGRPKSFQSPQFPPRKGGDIFMEAGKLATEYLVSQGLLPPSALSGKWQNGSLKKQVQDFQEFRPQEGDVFHVSPEGRSSALSRLGNSVSDSGPGRRRYSDEYGSRGFRNHAKGNRKGGSFRGHGWDWSREYERSGSSSDRARASPGREGGDDTLSGRTEERELKKDSVNGVEKSGDIEFAQKTEDPESDMEKYMLSDDVGSKAGSSGAQKDVPGENDGEVGKKPDDFAYVIENSKEVKNGNVSEKTKEVNAEGGSSIQSCAADGAAKRGTNLLEFCKFAKVPTRIRSSLASKLAKVDPVTSHEDEHQSADERPLEERALAEREHKPIDPSANLSHELRIPESEVDAAFPVHAMEDKLVFAYGDEQSKCTSSQPSQETESLPFQSSDNAENKGPLYSFEQGECLRSQSFPDTKPLNVQNVEDPEELGSSHGAEQDKYLRSQSFPGGVILHQKETESNQDSSGFGSCFPPVRERTEKRVLEASDAREGTKKPRECFPSAVMKTNAEYNLPNLSQKTANTQEEGASTGKKLLMDIEQQSFPIISQYSSSGEPCVDYAQEKQLFPSSFKICDLNLMQTSEANENHQNDTNLLYPSISGNKNAAQIDIDLSISNPNFNMSSQYSKHSLNGKEIEVIDLEDDSAQEVTAVGSLERKRETLFTGLESYSNQAHNPGAITDVQDNYDGLMLSDYLNSFQSCAAVPPEINALPNEMGIPNGEGTLGIDESIYMSLDELSFMRAWDQPPPQDYEKPF